MKTHDKTGFTYIQKGSTELLPGSAVGQRIRIRLEEHSIRQPFLGTLTRYLSDDDFPGYGWYLVQLDAPMAIYREAVSQILIFGRGQGFDGPPREIVYDSHGKQVLYYYKTPIEDMFLNPSTEVKTVFVLVGVLLDPSIPLKGSLSRNQLYIHRYAIGEDPKRNPS